MALRAISLFAGGGGLDLGLERAGIARTVCRVEHEAYAAAVLAARSEDGGLDAAPVWSDVSTFDGRPWRGSVDLVAGGFPCQDISNAGKRVGIEGERSGLWSEFARIIREVGPRYVFVENVSALVVRGLDVVLADLHALGLDAEWGTFRASDVGAPHRRERVFILAYARSIDGGRRPARPRRRCRVSVDVDAEDVADAECSECSECSEAYNDDGRDASGNVAGRCDEHMGDSTVSGRGREFDAGDRVSWPPGPADAEGWRQYLARWPGLEPALRRGADGMAHRAQRLRLLGNGVHPDQAVLAWRILWERMMESR